MHMSLQLALLMLWLRRAPMATTPDERPERQGKVQGAIKSVRVAVEKGDLVHRVAISAAVFAAIGADRPGTAVAVSALIFVYLGKK